MTTRDWLRNRLGIEENQGPNAPKVSDEELLNVLRREYEKDDGEDELTTQEIQKELPIVRKTTGDRLKELEGERVERRRAGTTDMWSLAEGELMIEINPEMGPVVGLSSRGRRKAIQMKSTGRRLGELGLFFLIIGMTIWLSEINQVAASVPVFLGFGYSFGLVGGAIYGGASLLRLFGLIAPRLVERYLVE